MFTNLKQKPQIVGEYWRLMTTLDNYFRQITSKLSPYIDDRCDGISINRLSFTNRVYYRFDLSQQLTNYFRAIGQYQLQIYTMKCATVIVAFNLGEAVNIVFLLC